MQEALRWAMEAQEEFQVWCSECFEFGELDLVVDPKCYLYMMDMFRLEYFRIREVV